jgi:multidrug efflux pump subunit AcrA (membrane-fusion protein)
MVNFPTRRPPRWRWALPVALVAVLAALGALYATGQLTSLQRRVLGQSTQVTYQTATASRGTVAETITATGPIAAAQTLPVSFTASGKLVDLKAAVGQAVKKGDVLAQLDTTDLQGALDQAKASLAQAEASYAKAQQGATPEEKAAAQVALENAQRAAQDAAKSAAASTASAQRDVESAQASVGASQTSLQAARDALAAAQAQRETKLAADKLAVDNAQKALEGAQATIATQPAIQKEQLDKARTDLWAAQISRDATCGRGDGTACASAKATVAGLETNINTVAAQAAQTGKQNEQTLGQAQAAVETAKATLASDEASQAAAVKTAENNVKSAQATVNTAQIGTSKAQSQAAASAQTAQASANTAQGQVKTAEASLAQTAAGPLKADVDIAAAQVANARVAVQLAQSNLDAATLKAPIDGTVAAVNGAIGQQISGGGSSSSSSSSSTTTTSTSGFITLVTLDDLQVTANVNEADVGKVKTGNPVSFTVSAFPGKTFAGQVTQIQPTGTTTSNVVTYAVTSSIKSVEGTLLYPGMTATVTVTTDERDNVVLVPNSALSFAQTASRGTTGTGQSGQSTGTRAQAGAASGSAAGASQGGSSTGTGQTASRVMVLGADGKPVATPVTTGLSDGTNTEVVAGLQEGQKVVTSQSGGTAATGGGTAATGSGTATGGTSTNGAATRTGAQTASNPLTGGFGGGAPGKP